MLRWLAALVLAGCGDGIQYHYDLDQPINVLMTPELEAVLDEDGWQVFMGGAFWAVEALGAPHADGPDPLPSKNETVRLTLGREDCTGTRAGYVRWRANNVLQVCPSMVFTREESLIIPLMLHEMGHVVGADHVPCDRASALAPDLDCSRGLTRYSGPDRAEICRFASGGFCRRGPDVGGDPPRTLQTILGLLR